MTIKRMTAKTKTKPSPETTARLKTIRAKYQREKPSLDKVLADNPQAILTTLGDLLQLHELTAQLKVERERQHLTLAEISVRTGIDTATLSKLENGKTDNPTVGTITRFANSLGKVVGCYLQDSPTLQDDL